MRVKWVWGFTTAGVLVVLGVSGCGRREVLQPSQPAKRVVAVAIPEWAPENPSPEFLGAARVLKPMPAEPSPAGEAAVCELATLTARLRSTYTAAYEFFGTVSDDQINRFLETKELRVRVGSLSPAQRAALDRWFAVYRNAMRGETSSVPLPDDYLAALYKEGADEGLSNVDAGFATVPVGSSTAQIVSTHRVHIWFWVRQEDGTETEFGMGFAQI